MADESTRYQLIESIEGFPRADGVAWLDQRTSFPDQGETTIREYLRRYFQSLAAGNGAVVLTAVPCGNLISEAGIENAVFLVRHFLHSLLSWGKPRRHKKDLDKMPPEPLNVVLKWSGLWNAYVQEYFLCEASNLNPNPGSVFLQDNYLEQIKWQ